MSLGYESPEFSEELRKRTNSDEEYRKKAEGVNWKILIVVKDLPFATYSVYADGEMVERKHIPAGEIENTMKLADFTVEIPTYDLSVEMSMGKKSLESLFMSGTIKVHGSIFKAMQYRGALEASGKIAAALASESAIPPKEEFAQKLRERGLL